MSRHSISAILLCGLMATSALHAEILPDDLAGSAWKVTPMDDPRAADPATDDSGWSQIDVNDSAQMRSAAPHIWLRRSVSMDPAAGAYAFYASRVYGGLQVFLNGAAARPVLQLRDGTAVFALPSPVAGPNLLALRLDTRLGLPSGVGPGAVRLMELQSARQAAFRESTSQTTLVLIYGILALLLFLSRGTQQTLWASILYGALSVTGLLASPLLRSLLTPAADAALLYASLGLAALIPAILMHYVTVHFDLAVPAWLVRLPLPVSAAAGLASAILYVIPMERVASIVLAVWYGLTLPIWALLLFRIIRQAGGALRPSGMAVLGMLLYLLFAEGTLLPGGEYLHSRLSVLGFPFAPGLLVPALLVTFRSLRSARAERKNTSVTSEPEWLLSLLSDHATKALEGPMRLLNEATRPGNGDAVRKAEKRLSSAALYSRLDGIMADVLELCHLEMQAVEEASSPVSARQAMETALRKAEGSRTLRINDDVLWRISQERLTDTLTRLTAFPGFTSFDRKDLIGTVDDEGNIHLRLLMHQANRAELRRIYEILTASLPDSEALWVKWCIIEESVRLLPGELRVRSLSGRYLAIDLTLPCLPGTAKKNGGATIPLVLLQEGDYLPPPPTRGGWKSQIQRQIGLIRKLMQPRRR